MIKPASDLIEKYIGYSENKTTQTLNKARGDGLVIEDAHMLLPGATYDTS